VPLPTRRGLCTLEEEAREIAATLGHVEEMDRDSFAQLYTGRKRTRYQRAAETLKYRPVARGDAFVSAFVKSEKFDPSAKVNPAPRMIQARNARYNIEVGRFLRPVEHLLYRMENEYGYRVIGKGLSTRARAQLLHDKMARFYAPVVLSLDCSRFDQHVSIEQLRMEHSVYLAANPDPYFEQLLSWQLRNSGATSSDIRYKTEGKRMSGDMNTALGNCLLMVMMARAALKAVGASNYELLDDGDDCLVILEQSEEWRLAGLVDEFLAFGHELKVENRATSILDVNWCQMKPMQVGGEWRFVADPRKVLSSMTAGTKYWSQPGARESMAFSVGQCLLALYDGVPLIQEYAVALCRNGTRWNNDIQYADIWYKAKAEKHPFFTKLEPKPVTNETRLSLERAWGISIQEQYHIETVLSTWMIDWNHMVLSPEEIAPGWELVPRAGTEPDLMAYRMRPDSVGTAHAKRDGMGKPSHSSETNEHHASKVVPNLPSGNRGSKP